MASKMRGSRMFHTMASAEAGQSTSVGEYSPILWSKIRQTAAIGSCALPMDTLQTTLSSNSPAKPVSHTQKNCLCFTFIHLHQPSLKPVRIKASGHCFQSVGQTGTGPG